MAIQTRLCTLSLKPKPGNTAAVGRWGGGNKRVTEAAFSLLLTTTDTNGVATNAMQSQADR